MLNKWAGLEKEIPRVGCLKPPKVKTKTGNCPSGLAIRSSAMVRGAISAEHFGEKSEGTVKSEWPRETQL